VLCTEAFPAVGAPQEGSLRSIAGGCLPGLKQRRAKSASSVRGEPNFYHQVISVMGLLVLGGSWRSVVAPVVRRYMVLPCGLRTSATASEPSWSPSVTTLWPRSSAGLGAASVGRTQAEPRELAGIWLVLST